MLPARKRAILGAVQQSQHLHTYCLAARTATNSSCGRGSPYSPLMAITVAKSMIGALGDLADCNKTPYDVISGEGKEIRDRYGPHYGWRKYRRQAVGCRCHRSPDLNADEPAGSLATMVLPELRALANRAGVKGTSGMRKNELIAAIEEIRRQANGAPAVDRSAQEHDKGDRPPSSEAPATQGNRPRPNRSIPKANRSARSGAAPPVKRTLRLR